MNKDDHIELDNFWPYRTIVLADQISRYTLSVVRAEAGLNLSQWRVLAAVAEIPGRTAAEVTTITPMDKTIVSRAVSSLIENGLIKKAVNASDKRRMSLTTTARGLKTYKKIAALLNATLMNSIENTPSNAQFTKSLNTYSGFMKQIAPKDDK